ncbi:response regulator [Paenibacillus hunanensis]|uniref:response regulator n=1 Tax=Paenibacillus hunanensis TaxID=539262 RepID=UPI002026C9F3|nr:response regulator [Paenibacillus hunanensis]MCL9659455.1 response regulator [Paenibacillus hunanensis]
MRVLLVDDDVIVTKGLRQMIPWQQLKAHIVGEARNGGEALEIARNHHPDLIITDIKMPIMDGLELCRQIHEQRIDTAIVLLSAHEDFEYARQAMQYGVQRYIVKPITRPDIEQLTEYIRGLSERKHQQHDHYTSLFGRELEQRCIEALQTGDMPFFMQLFDHQLAAELPPAEIKALCVRVLNLLFEFGERIDQGHQRAFGELDGQLHRLLELKTPAEMIAWICQQCESMLVHASEKRDDRQHVLVDYVKRHVQEHMSDPALSLASIADQLNRSPAYVSAVFSQSTGMKLGSYITSIRMEQARRLLLHPAIPVYMVSEQLGFQDAHYFARVFKKQEGMTPSEYRNLYLNGAPISGGRP